MKKNRYSDKQKGGIVGTIEIIDIDRETGEKSNVFKQSNVITLSGMNNMWQRIYRRDAETDYRLNNFVFGSDYGLEEGGDWTIFLPKPADRLYTKENQFPVYEDFPDSVVFNYPDNNTLQMGTLIDGKYVMDNLYPGEVDVKYNSATTRFENNEVFSYKRFPVRTISRLVDVQVIWTFTFVDSALYDCSIIDDEDEPPQPDHNFGIPAYAGYWGNNEIHKISATNGTLWTYSGHTDWVNDLALDENLGNLYSVSRDRSIRVLDIANGIDKQIIYDAHEDIINRIMADGQHIVTVSNDGTTKKWDHESGEEIWSFSPEGDSFAMDVLKDPEDDNYYALYRNGAIYKISSASGSEIHRWNIEYESVKIAIDREGDLYISIFDDSMNGWGYGILKLVPSTNVTRWVYNDFAGYVFGLIVDDELRIFTGDDQRTVRMFDRNPDEIWRFSRHTDIVRGLSRDTHGYLYSASIDQTVRKITPNGNQVWAYTGNESPASCVIAGTIPEN